MSRFAANAKLVLKIAARKPKYTARLFSEAFKALVLGKIRLRNMELAIDYACNMGCIHCSAVRLSNSAKEKLTIDEYVKLADRARKLGCLMFHITGGEPLLRPDLEQIIKALNPSTCGVSIQSNGLLATRERLLSLRNAGADVFCVSIDSGFQEEHDSFRNTPGAFDKAVDAVDTALEIGYQVMISTCVSHANLDSEGLAKIISMAEERGIWCSISLAVPIGNWEEQSEFMLTPEDQKKWRDLIKQHPLCHIDLRHNWRSGCGAVKEKLYITAYGDVIPCPFVQIGLGNIRNEDIGLIRKRAMQYSKFKTYSNICLAAEDADFIAKIPCYHLAEGQRLPISWQDVPEIQAGMAGKAI